MVSLSSIPRLKVKSRKLIGSHVLESVICHDIILASAVDTNLALATRRCCYMALDAIDGDSGFLSRACDCRAVLQAQREQRRARAGSSASKRRATSGMSETPPPRSGDASEDVDADETAMQGVLEEDDTVIMGEDHAAAAFERYPR
jgi:hypothetical protein